LHEGAFALEVRNNFVSIFNLSKQPSVLNENIDEAAIFTRRPSL